MYVCMTVLLPVFVTKPLSTLFLDGVQFIRRAEPRQKACRFKAHVKES